MNYQLSCRENQKIFDDLVLIDGFSNSGKSMVATIFGYLDRCEQWQMDYKYEYIASLEALGKIDRNGAETLLKMWSDNHIYDLFISRNVNLRPTDVSSPYSDGLEKKYLERLNKKDGDIIVEEIENLKPILPLHIHYIIGSSDILIKAFSDRLQIYIITLRNPIELVKLWYENNWINRIGKDPREFQLALETKDGVVPWFVYDYIDEYLLANDIEKSILTIYYFHKKMFEMVGNLEESHKNKILFIPFEKFVVNPDIYIDDICKRLNTKRNKNFFEIMERANLPREYDMGKYFKSEDLIDTCSNKNISQKHKDMLFELEDMHKEFLV